ncbi:MAG: winged helix-turn-helix transcriptional regulator [Thermoplasmataceae archaeon]
MTELKLMRLKPPAKNSVLLEKYGELMRLWTLPVTYALGERDHSGFNDLKKRIEGINSTTLSKTLDIMQKNGLIDRVIIPEKPVRVKYSLTEKGLEFHRIMMELSEFVENMCAGHE